MRDRLHAAGQRTAVALYSAPWLLVGAAAVAALIWALPEQNGPSSLPPVQQTRLASAVRIGGCVLRQGARARSVAVPVDGPAATAARPGVYDDGVRPQAIVAAMRKGVVVIRHRPDIGADHIGILEQLQEVVPRGTIVLGDARLPYAVAATAWRHVLACRSLNSASLDALRLFRGRYLGSGPDVPR